MAPPHPPIGANLARLRQQRHLTQEALAERAEVSVDIVKKLEQGRRDSARMATLCALAGALDTTVARLTGDPPTQHPGSPPAQPIGPAPSRTWPTMEGMPADDLSQLRHTIGHLVALDTQHGSTGLHHVGVRAFTTARRKLATTAIAGTPTVELTETVAELGQLAGWLLHDAGQDTAAHAMLTDALLVAGTCAPGPHRALLIVLDQLSMLAERRGAWTESLKVAERSLALLEHGSPRLRAMAHLRRGRALAAGGVRAGLADLDRAVSMIDDGTRADDPPWAWWINRPELDIHQAMGASALGEHATAVDRAHAAVAGLDPAQRRDATIFRAVGLQICTDAGAWGEAVHFATDLSTQLPWAGSARAVGMVRRAAHSLTPTTPSDVVDAIRTALGSVDS